MTKELPTPDPHAPERAEDLDADHLLAAAPGQPIGPQELAAPGQTLPLELHIQYCDRFGSGVDQEVRIEQAHLIEGKLVARIRLTHMARLA